MVSTFPQGFAQGCGNFERFAFVNTLGTEISRVEFMVVAEALTALAGNVQKHLSQTKGRSGWELVFSFRAAKTSTEGITPILGPRALGDCGP